MKLQDILKIKETSECIVHHELTEDWKNCYYQLKGDESNNNGEVVSKFEEKYNESGWGELGNDHESVFDPTQEVFEDSSLTTVHKREYKSSVFILMIQIRIKEYLSLDESKSFEDFEDWIEVGGHYAVQDLCEKIDCFEYELTVDKPDDKYLWFSHYELSSDYSKIWIEEIKTDNESINEVKEPIKEWEDYDKVKAYRSWNFDIEKKIEENKKRLNESLSQRVQDSKNNISPADRAIIDYKKMEREKNSRNQGGCLVVIIFLLSLTLSLII